MKKLIKLLLLTTVVYLLYGIITFPVLAINRNPTPTTTRPLPDLFIENVTFKRDSSGQVGLSTVRVKNIGQAWASSSGISIGMKLFNAAGEKKKDISVWLSNSKPGGLNPGEFVDILHIGPGRNEIVGTDGTYIASIEYSSTSGAGNFAEGPPGGTSNNEKRGVVPASTPTTPTPTPTRIPTRTPTPTPSMPTPTPDPNRPLPDLTIEKVDFERNGSGQPGMSNIRVKNIGQAWAHPGGIGIGMKLFNARGERKRDMSVWLSNSKPGGLQPGEYVDIQHIGPGSDVGADGSYVASIEYSAVSGAGNFAEGPPGGTSNNEKRGYISGNSVSLARKFLNAATAVISGIISNESSSSASLESEETPTLTPTPPQTAVSTPSPSPKNNEIEKIKQSLKYPIKELGNCKNKEDCKVYCDKQENVTTCVNFGAKEKLMTKEEAEKAKRVSEIQGGPSGCTDQDSCAKVCDKPENTEACLEYAKKNNLMTDDELEKAKKVANIISSGTKTPGGCKTPQGCRQYCSGDGSHIKECIEFARGAGLMSEEEANQTEKRDFLRNGGPGGCKSRQECESYCENDDHAQECEAFFKSAGVTDSKERDRSKPPKTGGGAVCTTRDECEAFCKNPANAEACKNVVIKKDSSSSKPEIEGDIGKLMGNINQMPQESRACLRNAVGAETFDKLMKGEMPTTPISGDVMQSCFAQGVEEYEQKIMPTKKPDDFSTEYGPGPGYRYNSAGEVEEVPYGTPVYSESVPEVQGISIKPSLFEKIIDLFRR